MYPLLLTLFACWLALPVLAQQQPLARARQRGYLTKIFQLTDLQARQLYERGLPSAGPDFFRQAVDSFATDAGGPRRALGPGYYLEAHAEGPRLVYELAVRTDRQIELLTNQVDLVLVVRDSLGRLRPDARVAVGGRPLPLDPATHTFRRADGGRPGLAAVTLDGHTTYHPLRQAFPYRGRPAESWARRLGGRLLYGPPLGYLSGPVRHLVRQVRHARYENFGLVGLLRAPFNEDVREARQDRRAERRPGGADAGGYLVVSQPRYRSGDTLRLKARVWRGHRGRPETRPLTLWLRGGGGPPKRLARLRPVRPGAYELQTVLADSLGLRAGTAPSLYLEDGRGRERLAGGFLFEDYELKNNTFALRALEKEPRRGQPQALFVRGQDANELNLLDARVRLTLVPASAPGPLAGRRLFVPDTLWTLARPLDPLGETRVNLPAAVFPDADLELAVQADFETADRETHTERLTLPYRRDPGRLRLTLRGDSVELRYDSLGLSRPHRAWLSISSGWAAGGTGWRRRLAPVQLPLRLKVEPLADFYALRDAAGRRAQLTLGADNAGLTLSADRTPDSLRLTADNPRGLPFWYFVYRGDRLRYRGYGPGLDLRLRERGRAAWHVSLHYRWGDELRTAEYTSGPPGRRLRIEAEQPAVAYPGQHLSLTYTVRDEAGRPVPDADLTSWAYTARFGQAALPALPDLNRPAPNRRGRRRFEPGETLAGTPAEQRLDWARWRRQLGLDSLKFYKFLYPESGQFYEYRPAPGGLTQVAPFVVDSGRVLAPVAFYLDGQPAYLQGVNAPEPYVAVAEPGLHTLTLRTADRRFTLHDVYLRPGHKLTLSVDPNQPCRELQAERPGPLRAGELEQLRRTVLVVRGEAPPLVQQGPVLRRLGAGAYGMGFRAGQRLAGPFRPDSLRLRTPSGGGGPRFQFEPLYEYAFGPGLLRLSCLDDPAPLTSLLSRAGLAAPLPLADFAPTEADLAAAGRRPSAAAAPVASAASAAPPRGTGRLVLRLPPLPPDADAEALPGLPVSPRLPAAAPRPLPRPTTASRPLPPPRLTLLTRPDQPGFYRVEPGLPVLGELAPGRYRVAVLLADSSALLPPELLLVEAKGTTYVQLTAADRGPGAALLRQVRRLLPAATAAAATPERREVEASQPLFYRPDWRRLSGRVVDRASGEGLPGVTVLVRGTTVGISTNADGQYSLQVPPEARRLRFSSVGYVSQEREIGDYDVLNAALVPSVQHLDEVVVTGYGMQERRELTASVMSVALQGRVAGVSLSGGSGPILIRGNNALAAGAAPPLLIVNGLPFDGRADDLDPADIVETKVLKPEQAAGLYGARAAAGVVFITTRRGPVLTRRGQPVPSLPDPAAAGGPGADPAAALRRCFADGGWWRPTLTTDALGRATARVRLPDDVTSWDTFVVGADGRGRTGGTSSRLRAFKTLRAELALPRFLVAGDRTVVLGKVLNYQPDTVLVQSCFRVAGAEQRPASRRVGAAQIDTLSVRAPAAGEGDSLRVEFSLRQASGYADGEERRVPVLPAGTVERVGTFAPLLAADTTLTLPFDPRLGPVSLRLESDALPTLQAEIEHLQRYPYLCNEQAASRLLGLLLARRIALWQGQKFRNDKAVRLLVDKLQAGRDGATGLWGTWAGTPVAPWVSAHVVRALLGAEAAGYPTRLDRARAQTALLAQLDRSLAPGGGHPLAAPDEALQLLDVLRELNAPLDFAAYLRRAEGAVRAASPRRLPLDRYLALLRLRQRLGLPYRLDSLRRFRLPTVLGGVLYADTLRPGTYFRYRLPERVGTTLLAYQVLRAQGGHAAELARLRAALLAERGPGPWASTYQAAQTLDIIGPDLLPPAPAAGATSGAGAAKAASETPAAGAAKVPGAQVEFAGPRPAGLPAGPVRRFPLGLTLPAEGPRLSLRKTGALPVYATAYQTRWNPAPAAAARPFGVGSTLGGQAGARVRLAAGRPAELVVTLDVKAEARYVLLEVPVPAGCSYAAEPARPNSLEAHREYLKHQVGIFLDVLPVGRHVFRVSLLPRFQGRYTLNPARAELMYFPTQFGRAGSQRVRVE